MIAKLTSRDLEDSITQLESQIETLEDTIEDSDSSDDDYASNVRKYKDLTMKLSTLKTERSNLTVTSKYNGIVSGTITKGKTNESQTQSAFRRSAAKGCDRKSVSWGTIHDPCRRTNWEFRF